MQKGGHELKQLFLRLEKFQYHEFLFGEGESFLYFDLLKAVIKTANILKKLGVTQGEHITIFVEASANYLVALLSVFAVGACAVPLDTNMTNDEVREIIDNVKSRVLLTNKKSKADFENCVNNIIGLDWNILFKTDFDPIKINNEFFTKVEPHREALVIFSSGSSGKPKGVVRSYKSVITQMEILSKSFSLQAGERMLCTARPQHSYGLENVMAALYSGVSICFNDAINYNNIRKLLEDTHCTILVGVPFMYDLLVKMRGNQNINHKLRLALSAGAPLLKETNQAFEKLFHIPVTQIYGSSETPSSTANLNIGEHKKYTSVGQPFAGVKIKVVDETGDMVPHNTVGEILIKSDFASDYYFNEPELTKKHYIDGWFCTGDLGYWSEDNLLYLQGKIKCMINVAGNKVNPEDVEKVLMAFPGVKEVMVTGIPNHVYGEIVKAVIVTEGDVSIDETALLKHCQGKIADFKIPRIIEYSSALLRTTTGKIKRNN